MKSKIGGREASGEPISVMEREALVASTRGVSAELGEENALET